MDGTQWRVLTKCDPLEEEIANHPGILAVRTSFPRGSDGKASVYNAGDPGLIPESGRSAGEGNGNPAPVFLLENPMDRGAWWATVFEVAKS